MITLQFFCTLDDLTNDGTDAFDDNLENNPQLQKFEADLLQSPTNDISPSNTQPSSLEGSLFGEVHLNEIKKLERMLEDADNQKLQLNQRLNESQLLLDKAQTELNNQSNKLSKFFENINSLISMYGDMDFDNSIEANSEFPELARLKHILQKQMSDSNLSHLREEVIKLQNKLQAYEVKSAYLEEDLKTMTVISEDIFGNLSLTQDDLLSLSEDLAALYHHICLGINI
jgi:protein bicaudal D